jgi:hypothetical protein
VIVRRGQLAARADGHVEGESAVGVLLQEVDLRCPLRTQGKILFGKQILARRQIE